MRYIIRNCPARNNGYFKDCVGTHHNECKDCTDCLLKQIVDKCKDQNKPKSCREYDNDIQYLIAYGRHNLANEILSMLEIQECE